MAWWAEAFLTAAVAMIVYLVLLKRIRRRHRPKVPPITIRSEDLDNRPGTQDKSDKAED
ncbi:hypothetical protein ACW9UR_22170 [Halovulum sp. GXIMD14794]